MSAMRTPVAWVIGEILSFLDYKKNLKVGLGGVTKHSTA